MSISDGRMVLCGKVLDGSLSPPIDRGAVAVVDDRIAWVGPAQQLPERFRGSEFERREKPGWSIMPGLIDGHTHISFGEARSEEELALYTPVEFRALRAIWNARKVLQAGVTSAFDAATVNDVAQCVRDAIDADMFEGPRFAVSGRQLTSHQGLEDSFPNNMEFPPGQAGVLIKSKDDLIEAIRSQVKDRVDAIKVSGSNDNLITPDALDGAAFTFEEFEVIARETHRLGKICTVHARSRDSVIAAAKAGFDIIFHASYIDNEGIDACLKAGSVITPALTFLVNSLEASNGEYGVSSMDAVRRELDAAATGLAKAYRAGVPMICGSESGWSPVPYGEWHARELQVFVEFLGISTLEAIHCATLGATRCLKRFGDQVGKLEAGRFADLLVLDGDPSKDVGLLMDKRKLAHVFKGGKSVDLTPPTARKRWYFEKHKMFLNGWFHYDPDQRKGFVRS
jgi:imidazolonepropionase-like amidohydrolase